MRIVGRGGVSLYTSSIFAHGPPVKRGFGRWMSLALLLLTCDISSCNWKCFTQMIWIDNRNYPGGPSAYLVEQQTAFEARLVAGGYLVNGWLQDGLILYRFWFIFGGRFQAVLIPVLLFLGTIAVSIALMIVITGTSYFHGISATLVITYYALSVALNLLATVAITVKLWISRRRLRFVSSSVSRTYMSVSAILIESAALYTLCGMVFLIPFGMGDPFQNVILPTLAQMESIAPLLIIMRVAQGQAWTPDTTTDFAVSAFPGPSGMRHSVSTGADIESSRPNSIALSIVRSDSRLADAIKVAGAASNGVAHGDGDRIFPAKL
ncbi:hypothetical protein EXIGLDRAFT_623232 [Exidia glandulosa HHB12029]|uniref:G-protein coupled receptors family 3 profile domain-containing protein n=1 Tax=Exidia glandulosa HHB12029 TaxID=1314781 RepID=A0A165DSX9_EXIGL|nr:hypothetical protein EXIGLDRAFT_623232 [Exidia glandulosa HHB12029]